MENKLNNLKGKIADNFELPREVVMDVPKVTITGVNEIIIENHKGILSFDNDRVCINTRVGVINIEGSGFEILFIGGSTITIGGIIKSFNYERGGNFEF